MSPYVGSNNETLVCHNNFPRARHQRGLQKTESVSVAALRHQVGLV